VTSPLSIYEPYHGNKVYFLRNGKIIAAAQKDLSIRKKKIQDIQNAIKFFVVVESLN
jgi:hypothetical protein